MKYVENLFKNFTGPSLVAFVAVPWFFWGLFEGLLGGSIGKLLTGIRTRRKDGGKINIGTATGRSLVKIISCLLFMLGCLLALFDRKHQSLHDKVANTMVLRR